MLCVSPNFLHFHPAILNVEKPTGSNGKKTISHTLKYQFLDRSNNRQKIETGYHEPVHFNDIYVKVATTTSIQNKNSDLW